MAGELTPVVMVPRYSTYASDDTDQDFTTIAMDVTEYETAILNVWRTVLIGSTPTFKIHFEESTDQTTWFPCAGPNVNGSDPGDITEEQYTAELKRRWFRIRIRLAGTGVVATCWCVGFLEERIR